MRNQFAVIHDTTGGLYERVLFESESSGEVYAWLKKNSALDSPGYRVIDRFTSVSWEEGTFVREFEEEMAKASKTHACVSEERIRTIVREEFSQFLDKLCEKAGLDKEVQTLVMSDAMYAVIENISRQGDRP